MIDRDNLRAVHDAWEALGDRLLLAGDAVWSDGSMRSVIDDLEAANSALFALLASAEEDVADAPHAPTDPRKAPGAEWFVGLSQSDQRAFDRMPIEAQRAALHAAGQNRRVEVRLNGDRWVMSVDGKVAHDGPGPIDALRYAYVGLGRQPWRYTEPDHPAPPIEEAMHQAVRRAFDAEVKRRDDAVARALWAGATETEREALRKRLADDLRSGRVTADEVRASFAPDRIKAAEDANVVVVNRWLSADAGIYHLPPEPRDVLTRIACGDLLRALGAPVRPPERTRGPSLYAAACKAGRERRPAPVVAPAPVPSTMGELLRMGSRPLCTVADGPRYDFDEVP